MPQESETVAVTLTIHPPEHGRRANVPALAGQGCCCCCCCSLYTLGGIIGAVVAPLARPEPEDWSHVALMDRWTGDDDRLGGTANYDQLAITEDAPTVANQHADSRFDVDEPPIALPKSRRSAESIYWWTLLVITVVWLVTYSLANPHRQQGPTNRIGAAILVLVLFFPVGQLGATMVTGVVLAISRRADKGYQVRQLGKLTLGTVAGALFGILLMMGMFALSSGGKAITGWFVAGFVLSIIVCILSVVGLAVLSRR